MPAYGTASQLYSLTLSSKETTIEKERECIYVCMCEREKRKIWKRLRNNAKKF
jgi:hypothetical protein